MSPYREFRKDKRYDHLSIAMFNIKDPESYFYAQLNNYSSNGMGFETPLALRPGTEIDISLQKKPFKASPTNYHARVRWCHRSVDDDSYYPFKIGVNYL